MSDIIQNLMNSVIGDGARPSKYRCEINLPSVFSTHDIKNLDIICKGASFPAKTNEVIEVKYKGRTIPIPGQEKYTQSLDLSFYVDPKHDYKLIFNEWMQALNYNTYQDHKTLHSTVKEMQDNQSLNLSSVKTNIILTQLDFENNIDEVAYEFYNVFPKEISSISLGEFNVVFSFTHFEIHRKKDGITVNSEANKILQGVQNGLNDIVNSALGFIESNYGKKINLKAEAVMNKAQKIQDRGLPTGSSYSEFMK